MMTVNEAIEKLEQLRALGHGALPVVVVDTRSGVTEGARIGTVQKTRQDGIGWECDEAEGTEYVAVYVG